MQVLLIVCMLSTQEITEVAFEKSFNIIGKSLQSDLLEIFRTCCSPVLSLSFLLSAFSLPPSLDPFSLSPPAKVVEFDKLLPCGDRRGGSEKHPIERRGGRREKQSLTDSTSLPFSLFFSPHRIYAPLLSLLSLSLSPLPW